MSRGQEAKRKTHQSWARTTQVSCYLCHEKSRWSIDLCQTKSLMRFKGSFLSAWIKLVLFYLWAMYFIEGFNCYAVRTTAPFGDSHCALVLNFPFGDSHWIAHLSWIVFLEWNDDSSLLVLRYDNDKLLCPWFRGVISQWPSSFLCITCPLIY